MHDTASQLVLDAAHRTFVRDVLGAELVVRIVLDVLVCCLCRRVRWRSRSVLLSCVGFFVISSAPCTASVVLVLHHSSWSEALLFISNDGVLVQHCANSLAHSTYNTPNIAAATIKI